MSSAGEAWASSTPPSTPSEGGEPGGNRAEAVALARKAREGYARASRTKDLAEVDAWLAERQ